MRTRLKQSRPSRVNRLTVSSMSYEQNGISDGIGLRRLLHLSLNRVRRPLMFRVGSERRSANRAGPLAFRFHHFRLLGLLVF